LVVLDKTPGSHWPGIENDQAALRSKSLVFAFRKLRELINAVPFFAPARKPSHDAVRILGSSTRNPDIKMDDVQSFTAFTICMLWPPIASGIVTRMKATSAIKTKTDSE
jgi:hypothetical protein